MYRIKPSFWIFLSYFTYTYFIPLLFAYLLNLDVYSYKNEDINFKVALIYSIAFLFFSFFLSLTRKKNNYSLKKIKTKYLDIILIILLTITFGGLLLGLSSFRYLGSEAGSSENFFSIFLFSTSSLISQLIFFYIFFYDHKLFFKLKYKVLLSVIIFSSINGIATALFFVATFLIIIFPKTIIPFISKKKISFKNFTSIILIFIMSLMMANFLFKWSISIKTGEEFSNVNLDDEVYLTTNYVNDRFSAHLYSYLINLSDNTFDYNLAKTTEAFSIIFSGFNYRFSKIINIGSEKPKFDSIGRLNLEKINYSTWKPSKAIINRLDREGTAPGFLGSFFLIFSFPFNFIFPVIMFLILSLLINRIAQSSELKFNLFGYFIITYFFYSFFLNNPFDFLLIFDETVVLLVLIIFFLKFNLVKIDS